MTKLVYIGGYGRSGSTLLEYLMTASPAVMACGETVGALREQKPGRTCSCGRLGSECPIWGPLEASPKRLQGWSHVDLDLALLKLVSASHEIMVDSSKTAWGEATAPFKLRRELGRDFLLVHLVRDPRAVSWSIVRSTRTRAKRRGEPAYAPLRCLVGALGWVTANLSCELFGRLYPNQYVLLRYEDFARSPAEVLTGLFARHLPGQDWRFDAIGTNDNRHQLYGNRMRSKHLELADIEVDEVWKDAMPATYRALVAPFSFFLRQRYGYV